MPKQLQNKVLQEKIVTTIKTLRKEKKITFEIYYFVTGIHLTRIEQGKQNITVATLATICNYFEISLRDFFEQVGN